MRKSIVFALISLAFVFVACEKEKIQEQNNPVDSSNTIVFTASLTKTAIDANDEVVSWVAGDEVKFVWADGSTTATASSSGSSTTFSIEVGKDITELYAVYPATACGSYSEGKVNVNFKGSYSDGDFAANDICVARAVKTGDTWNTTLAFKNAACILKVGVAGSSFTRLQVMAVGDESIFGELPVSIDGGGEISFGAATNTGSTVRMEVSGPGNYYIPVMPGVTLSNGFRINRIKVDVDDDGDGNDDQLTPFFYNGSFTTTRGQIIKLNDIDAHAGQYYVTPSGAGTKAGQSWSQAMDIDKFKAFVTNQDNHFLLKGSTFHFSAEEFSFGDDYLVLHYPDHSKVAFTLEGTVTASDTTVFVGRTNTSENNKAGVLWPQANSNITVKNIKFTGTNGKGNSAAIRLNNGAETFTLDHCYFRGNRTNGNGASIAQYNGCVLTVRDCSFSGNTGNGGAIFLNSASATAIVEDSEFKYNTNGAIRADAASSVEIARSNFTGNNGTSSGPALRFGGSPTVTVTDCNFVDNYCNQGAGTIAVSSNTVSLSISGGTFEGNHADGTTDDDSAGAVIYDWGGSTVTFTDVLFKENYNNVGSNTQTGGIIRLGKNTCVARFNGCTFDGNYSYRSTTSNNSLAAIIQNRQGGTKYYFNACEFKHNSSGLDSGRIGGLYGMLVAAYSTCTIGMNNCSIHDNYGQRNPTGDPDITWFHLSNTSNTIIFSNSTIIGDAQRTPQAGGAVLTKHWSVLKLNTTGNYYLLNDIICSKYSDGVGIWCGAENTSINAYYTKMSPEGDGRAVWTNDTGAGFNYYSAYLGSYDGTHVWNGTFSAGTNKDSFAATSDVNAQIESADSGFYEWLVSIEALGKDINGNNRGATSWPGCYQNN